MKNKSAPHSVDAYIRSFPAPTQRMLESVRVQIRSLAPRATERISYGIPTFDLDRAYLLYLAGWKNHISIYPVSADAARTLGDEAKPYLSGKGTLKFPLTQPLPADLIRQFVEIRIQELVAKPGGRT